MEQKNDTLDVKDVVFMLLETLKSNGTFDEIRRHYITDIDAKPTYQNWKQCIESNVNKFLSKVKFTPELNKNTVRECLRKHLLDGCETQDIEEGADRLLTQVLAPHSLSIFEHKIAIAVDEYLGIKNEASPIELNGLKESSMNLIKASNIEISTVLNPKIDFIPDSDNIVNDKTLKGGRKNLRSDKKEKSSSLCKEFKSLKGNQSKDANCAGRSSKQKSSVHKTSTSDKSKSSSSNHKSSKKDKSCKEVVENSKNIVEKYKDFINNPKEVVNKSKDIVDKSKNIVDKSKDIVNKPIDIVDKPKDIIEKSKDNVLNKNSNSNSSSHKSNQTDRKRTKRSLEEKKKSSSLCKKPNLFDGNRSDGESNSEGSLKQKSTIHKNKSSSSDKTKLSSSNHKSSSRDNNSTEVVDKSKDKFLSKDSSSSSHKNNRTDTKRLKLSPVKKNKLPTNKVNDEERKPEKSELNDFQNSIHSNNDIDIIMKDSVSTLSNQILHKEIENNGAKVLVNDKSLYTFKGFSEADAIPCKNDQLLKNMIKTLQVQMNNLDNLDNGFKGFTSAETNPCKHRDNVYAKLIKMKESKSSTGFIGFSKEETAMSFGHIYVDKLLKLCKKQNNVDNHQQNVKCGENRIQNGKPFNEVMAALLYKNNNGNEAKSKENYSTPINDTKKDSPTVNNNNHKHDKWVVEQEIKYKLVPLKVKLERLMGYECNNANRVSDSTGTHIINSRK